MTWALGAIALGALAVLLWHMQRPLPRRIAISFARFVPALPPAPAGWSRIAPTWPRDPLALACLLAAAAAAGWAVLDHGRQHRAARPGHLGLRVVLDLSHSMTVADDAGPRFASALARVEAARAMVRAAGADSLCLELVGVAAGIGPALPLAAAGPLPPGLAPLPEGGEPARLVEAATAPAGGCAPTHALVVTDLPPPALPAAGELRILWDQVGRPVANSGLRGLALEQAAFGAEAAAIRIEGVHSGGAPPTSLRLSGPGGPQDLPIHPLPEAEGRWFAIAAYGGPGDYALHLPAGDGYAGDDRATARLDLPARVAVDWRLADLPRPAALPAGGEGDLLVAAWNGGADPARPVLLVHSGFGQGPAGRMIGPFLDDPALFGALNFDALEAALPAALAGALPPGFAPVMTDEAGGVLVARRPAGPGQAAGLILPAPRPDLPEPARSLSLTLFFSVLADLAARAPRTRALAWTDVAEAWRESLTGRPAGAPADLALLAETGTARQALPLWPWWVLAALVALLAERLLRLARLWRRGAVVP